MVTEVSRTLDDRARDLLEVAERELLDLVVDRRARARQHRHLEAELARAKFCNRRHAALMVRIHADGSTARSLHGVSTLVPAWHRGWTDDIFAASLRAGRAVQTAVLASTGAVNRGVVQRSDLTGFNWADVPAVLIETGFMTNPAESTPLQMAAYQQKVALGITRGVAAFVAP